MPCELRFVIQLKIRTQIVFFGLEVGALKKSYELHRQIPAGILVFVSVWLLFSLFCSFLHFFLIVFFSFHFLRPVCDTYKFVHLINILERGKTTVNKRNMSPAVMDFTVQHGHRKLTKLKTMGIQQEHIQSVRW